MPGPSIHLLSSFSKPATIPVVAGFCLMEKEALSTFWGVS